MDLMGLFMAVVREMAEMRYQWEERFVVDDRRFRERFGAKPEDEDEAARARGTTRRRSDRRACGGYSGSSADRQFRTTVNGFGPVAPVSIET